MAREPPRWLRRFRAGFRRLSGGDRGEVEGFVDGYVAGEVRGWAMDPRQPNRRVHIIAVEAGRVVAETLADRLRVDLVQDGRGDGRHAFRMSLATPPLDGEARRIQVQAIIGGKPVRLLRGDMEIEPPGAEATKRAMAGSGVVGRTLPAAGPQSAIVEAAPAPLALAMWRAEGSEAEPPADWGALGRAGGRLVRLGRPDAGVRELARAHTVIFARPGDRIDPTASVLLQRSRPLADVLTWDGTTEASRRPEARPLGLLLGETLGGAFALRGHVFNLMGEDFAQALARGEIQRAELLLAARPELRWAHLPARITSGTEVPVAASPIEGLHGFRWVEPDGGRPGRLIPDAFPGLITIALWPRWNAAAEASLRSLLAQTHGNAALEVLAPSGASDRVRVLIEALGDIEGSGVSVREVDAPAAATPGAWLAALTAAASGEAVIICQAGVTLRDDQGALEQMIAWACSPLAGPVTAPVARKGRIPLAGLALERTADGWAVRSAYTPALEGRSRPVLAAPASFLAIGRNKLAMLGEAAAARLPAGGVDLDLGLRVRRLGLTSVLLGDIAAEAQDGVLPAGEITGAPLGVFDPDELAAAAAAYPIHHD